MRYLHLVQLAVAIFAASHACLPNASNLEKHDVEISSDDVGSID